MNSKASIIQGLLRHVLTAGGGAGFVASDEDLTRLVSALVTCIGIGWSIWEKVQAHRREHRDQ
jgi:hypothetical protein